MPNVFPSTLMHVLLLQGYGVYRFADKYGANVDGYSPIYTPDTWSESGNTYKLGTKGLIAWYAFLERLRARGMPSKNHWISDWPRNVGWLSWFQ